MTGRNERLSDCLRPEWPDWFVKIRPKPPKHRLISSQFALSSYQQLPVAVNAFPQHDARSNIFISQHDGRAAQRQPLSFGYLRADFKEICHA